MQRLSVSTAGTILIVLFFASVGLAKEAAQWRLIKSTEARFVVSLPGTAQFTRGKTRSGKPIVTYKLSSGSGGTYRVSYQKLGTVADSKLEAKIFTNVRKSFDAKKNHTVLSERQISLGSAGGRELLLEIKTKTTQVTLRLRMYVLGDRFYQLIFATEKGQERPDNEARFFGSFRIL